MTVPEGGSPTGSSQTLRRENRPVRLNPEGRSDRKAQKFSRHSAETSVCGVRAPPALKLLTKRSQMLESAAKSRFQSKLQRGKKAESATLVDRREKRRRKEEARGPQNPPDPIVGRHGYV